MKTWTQYYELSFCVLFFSALNVLLLAANCLSCNLYCHIIIFALLHFVAIHIKHISWLCDHIA